MRGRCVRNSFAHRRRAPGAGFAKTALWDLCSQLCQSTMSWNYRFRVEGAHHIPLHGPAIFIANHQSYLDPVIHGLAAGDRAPRPMAKESLFRNPIFGGLLRALNCISVRTAGGNRDAFRAALEELDAGRTVMIYPEGTRSHDGSVQEFRRGVELLARRASAPIVPMGIDGAFDVWPMGQKLPRWHGRIWATVGRPIPPDAQALLFQDAQTGLDELRRQVEELMQNCRMRLRANSGGRFPAWGLADAQGVSHALP
ncbi:MAG: 1-acyl-sn-glycerol-3-phosphate acyltransferase [Phycisphaerales bacterium]|nr:1-acyl-sn-glycerol-3-phosphate acyltransferase [Phycisphaerales bacterium]